MAVALFCHAYNCARYTSCIMINDGFHFTATNVESIIEEHEVPWDAMLYIITHTLL